MATTTGLYGGTRITQQTGLDQLRLWKKDQAQDLLTELRANLNNRTGVVRLLHTSKTDKEMTFKTAGGFKQIFLNGGKLQRSGEVIRDLLRQAGANAKQLESFENYVAARGRSGVEASRVKDAIAQLNLQAQGAVVAASEGEALKNLGMEVSMDRAIGSGAYGTIYSFEHAGQAMVYKRPKQENRFWEIQLQDSTGSPLQAVQEKPADSFAHVEDNSNAPPPAHNQETSRSFSVGSDASDQPAAFLKNYVKNFENQQSEFQPAQPQSTSEKVSTVRSGVAVAARIKGRIPEAIEPSVYVVKATLPNGNETFHAVGGGSTFKAWAANQTKYSALQTVGLVMPKAAGVQPMVYNKQIHLIGPVTQAQVNSEDLKPMAISGLKGLQNFSQYGFIHGDYKPENMIWDTNAKTLGIIDLDGMTKTSKYSSMSSVPKVGSDLYLHPLSKVKSNAVGVGRDLFALGLCLLETAAYAGRQPDEVAEFNRLQKYLTEPSALIRIGSQSQRPDVLKHLEEATKKHPPDSVQHFALQAIRHAIEYEGNRLDNKDKSYDRWSPQKESHPLNVLAKHPAVRQIES